MPAGDARGPESDGTSSGDPGSADGLIRHLYVHAPFCARRCNYCDFAVHVAKTGDLGAWLVAIGREWAMLTEEEPGVGDVPSLRTLYVGGGTPSHLGAGAMEGLAAIIGPHRLENPRLEWTSEANPESFTPELAARWREAGVNRISLGVQSFQENVLRWMGRLHGAEGAERAVRTARQAGYDNLSVDLIFGLPAHLDRDWSADLERALALEPEHVSLYGLTIEDGTSLGRRVAEGREIPLDEEAYRAEYHEAVERLTDAGYGHYEVSNFARPGRESRHNAAYWSDAPYLGLGNGAHSFLPPRRLWNVREWTEYRDRLMRGEDPTEDREELGPEERRLEAIWLGLRTSRGLELNRPAPRVLGLLEGWASEGLARIEGDRVRLTPEGWLVMDRLTVELEEILAEDDHVLTDDSGVSDLSA